jgi:hypothetical protein
VVGSCHRWRSFGAHGRRGPTIIGTESRVKPCEPGIQESERTKTSELRSPSPCECAICGRRRILTSGSRYTPPNAVVVPTAKRGFPAETSDRHLRLSESLWESRPGSASLVEDGEVACSPNTGPFERRGSRPSQNSVAGYGAFPHEPRYDGTRAEAAVPSAPRPASASEEPLVPGPIRHPRV